jgi:hypothetical protein
MYRQSPIYSMEKLKQLETLNETAQIEGAKFYAGNKSAGTRLRKVLQEIKTLSHEMRKDVSDVKNQ